MKNKHPNRAVLIGFLINSIISIIILTATPTGIALDMQFHDTYFVVGVFDLSASILQFFFIYSLFYFILFLINRSVNSKAAKIHYYLTTFIALCLSSFLLIFIDTDFPKRYFSHEEYKPLFADFYGLFTALLAFYIFIQISFFFYFIFTIKKIK
ncbi:hypothetical protein V9L05_06560 [Bernardetia sp. Wsw4-3y2]|uniref:hypothetical protein n=1 Tax=Bernardetia sp. Wsw4-3y2 TaxID=3127471 RepID=UPI0030CB4B48